MQIKEIFVRIKLKMEHAYQGYKLINALLKMDKLALIIIKGSVLHLMDQIAQEKNIQYNKVPIAGQMMEINAQEEVYLT